MKAKALIPAIFIFIVLLSADVFAQRGARTPGARPQQRYAERPAERAERSQRMMTEDCQFIDELTEEQEAQIRAIRLQGLEQRTTHRNQVDELRARKRNLMTQAQPDTDAINSIIDEMTSLKNAQMKERVTHRQAIRELLTDEQRILFDSRTSRRQGGRQPHGRQGGEHGGMRRW